MNEITFAMHKEALSRGPYQKICCLPVKIDDIHLKYIQLTIALDDPPHLSLMTLSQVPCVTPRSWEAAAAVVCPGLTGPTGGPLSRGGGQVAAVGPATVAGRSAVICQCRAACRPLIDGR